MFIRDAAWAIAFSVVAPFSAPAFAASMIEAYPSDTNEASATNSTVPCELHVWPGNDLRSTYHGWLHGGIVDGAVQGRDGYRPLPPNPLPVAIQRQRLQQLPLAELMGVSGYSVVVHETPLDSRTLRSTPGRLVTDSSTCYAEFAIDDAFFQEDIVNGRFLKVLFRFRKFDGGQEPTRRFGTYIQEKLVIFSSAQSDADPKAGSDELANAFAQAIKGFGTALNLPPKASRHRK